MPQKFWEIGRETKTLGNEDLAAMSMLEILEWLRDKFDIVDIKPTDVDITDIHDPPFTTKGDPYLRNVVENWTVHSAYGHDEGDAYGKDIPSLASGNVMMILTRKEVERYYRKIADADQVASF